MSTIVQKYGGTSVGSPEKLKQVASRIVKSKAKGNNVVVIVSAMGHTTDELIDLMDKVTKNPDPREYDMLLSTGEQVSASLLTMAIHALGYKAVSLTGWQAGIHTEDIPSKARITHTKLDRVKKELAKRAVASVQPVQKKMKFRRRYPRRFRR